MKFAAALGLKDDNENRMISLVGGGGKTSSIYTLAQELSGWGKQVLITTTTAMYKPVGIVTQNISVLGDHVTAEGKLKGIKREQADKIFWDNLYDYILVEADGSRGLPIKAPAGHEPVIPETTGILIGVIGMDAFGKKMDSAYVHRPELLSALTGTPPGERINDKTILNLVFQTEGLFKDCPKETKRVLLFNKVLDDKTKETAIRIGHQVINDSGDIDRILIGAVQEADPIKELITR